MSLLAELIPRDGWVSTDGTLLEWGPLFSLSPHLFCTGQKIWLNRSTVEPQIKEEKEGRQSSEQSPFVFLTHRCSFGQLFALICKTRSSHTFGLFCVLFTKDKNSHYCKSPRSGFRRNWFFFAIVNFSLFFVKLQFCNYNCSELESLAFFFPFHVSIFGIHFSLLHLRPFPLGPLPVVTLGEVHDQCCFCQVNDDRLTCSSISCWNKKSPPKKRLQKEIEAEKFGRHSVGQWELGEPRGPTVIT